MVYISYFKYFRMLVVEDVNEKYMEGRHCFRKSFKSLCKKYGTPTKITTMNGKIHTIYWNKINKMETNKCKEFQRV